MSLAPCSQAVNKQQRISELGSPGSYLTSVPSFVTFYGLCDVLKTLSVLCLSFCEWGVGGGMMNVTSGELPSM